MISFDFAYYRPTSLPEAVQTFSDLAGRGQEPLYFAGGTEIITRARSNRVFTGAVIDLKAIPETRLLGEVLFGANVSLTTIREAGLFPLLGAVIRHVADRTARNQITVGGNICGEIRYREAVLPFLLAEGQVLLAGPEGLRLRPLEAVFDGQMRLAPGELLVQLTVPPEAVTAPYAVVRRTKAGKTGYPLVTVAGLRLGGRLRVAFSGVAAFPFRSREMEEELNRPGLPPEARVERALAHLPAPILDDVLGSAEFRRFVLRNALLDVAGQLEA